MREFRTTEDLLEDELVRLLMHADRVERQQLSDLLQCAALRVCEAVTASPRRPDFPFCNLCFTAFGRPGQKTDAPRPRL